MGFPIEIVLTSLYYKLRSRPRAGGMDEERPREERVKVFRINELQFAVCNEAALAEDWTTDGSQAVSVL
jgi:hypothetical protein